MNTLYIEAKMGAAGDMLMAALYELVDEKIKFITQMNSIFGNAVSVLPDTSTTCGITGTHMEVKINTLEHSHHHHHSRHHSSSSHSSRQTEKNEHTSYTYPQLLEKITALPIPEDVRRNALAIYRAIGEAESKVHNTAIEQIHFHEVGTLDAIADVVGCCLLFSYLHADRIIASPIHVGNGTVVCAHGELPVPAPATAELLKGIPYYTGDIPTELCTPTGAAILRHFVTEYAQMPVMDIDRIGIGIGTKELPVANVIRIYSGTLTEDTREIPENHTVSASEAPSEDFPSNADDTILDLSCNMDDMTGEALGYAMDLLLDAGALDVYYSPVYMKKNRPGILLHCFCEETEKEKFISLIFRHTTTRGIRFQHFERVKLTSSFEEVKTPYGTVRNKISSGYGVTRSKYEYEDLKKIADKQKISLREAELGLH